MGFSSLVADVPGNVSAGGILTLVVPLGLLVIVIAWGWWTRKKASR